MNAVLLTWLRGVRPVLKINKTVLFWCSALLLAALLAQLTCPAPLGRRAESGVYNSNGNFSHFIDRGKSLLYGVKDEGASFSMPLVSVAAALLPDKVSTGWFNGLAFVLQTGIYLLCFLLGAAGGKPLKGALAALLAFLANLALKGNYEMEQLFFSFFLLLFLNVLFLRNRKRGPAADLALGLSAGFTMLVRPVLFLFPPVAAACSGNGPGSPAENRRGAALFLVCAYVLLLPWAAVNYSLHGRLSLFEPERAACNVITGVMGSVYTAEGDCRALAGLSAADNVYEWAAKEIVSHPLLYALSVLKRLLHIFYMFQALFFMALAGFLLHRDRDAEMTAVLVLYFVLLHSLMSVEARYFYPLRPLLAFLAAQGLSRFLPEERGAGRPAALAAVFAVSSALVLVVEVVIAAYPFRLLSEPAAYDRGLALRPRDAWLWEKKGEYLFRSGDAEGGIRAFYRAYESSGEKDMRLAYLLLTLKARAVSDIERPSAFGRGLDTPELLTLKALKEAQLKDLGDAAVSLRTAYSAWTASDNMLRGTPYGTDREILAKIRGAAGDFWTSEVGSCLCYWPPGERTALLKGLSGLSSPAGVPAPLPGRPGACARGP
jgi:hypothetical protein